MADDRSPAGDDPAAGDHYDDLADDWSEYAAVPWRAQVLWPTVDGLLPEVDGKRVLDVGCGDGYYAAELADRGVDVVGVDASREMVRVARDRYGDRAAFRQGDATDLAFLDGNSVDLVLCQHVLSHVADLDPVATEFARVLRSGGSVVLSTHHPFHEYLVVREEAYPDTRVIDGLDARPAVDAGDDEPTYAATERYALYWGGSVPDDGGDSGDPAVFHRRSLAALTAPLFDAGFAIRDLREPALADLLDDESLGAVAAASPDLLDRPPRSLCLRADLLE